MRAALPAAAAEALAQHEPLLRDLPRPPRQSSHGAVIAMTQHIAPKVSDHFPAPTTGGPQGSTLVLAIGPLRDWLTAYMRAYDLTIADLARCIGRDDAMVRGWFGVRGRDWRTQSPHRFVIHIISELTVEAVGIALTGNPRLVPELCPHMAEPVCQRCGAPEDCDHFGRELGQLAA
jgi:hypothetical protein